MAQPKPHQPIGRRAEPVDTAACRTSARSQLGVHFEVSGWKADGMPDLAGCTVREREGYAVELLSVLHVRYPNFHDLPMRGAELEFHVYLARNVGDERQRHYSGAHHRRTPRERSAMGLEERADPTHDSGTIPARALRLRSR